MKRIRNFVVVCFFHLQGCMEGINTALISNTMVTVFCRLQTRVLYVSATLDFYTIPTVSIKTGIHMESMIVAFIAFIVVSTAWIFVNWATASDKRSRFPRGLGRWISIHAVETIPWEKAHEAKVVFALCTRGVVARFLAIEFDKCVTLWALLDAGFRPVDWYALQVESRSVLAACMASFKMFMLAVEAGWYLTSPAFGQSRIVRSVRVCLALDY
jgi:hypothetical protein